MKQHNPDIDRLISLFLSGRLSPGEMLELEQWLEDSSKNREVFEQVKSIWAMSSVSYQHRDMAQTRDKIWNAGTVPSDILGRKKGKRKGLHLYWIKVAAVLLVLLTGGGIFFNYIQDNPNGLNLVVWTENLNPSGQRSSHRLSDGTKVWLNSKSSLKYPAEFSDTLRLIRLVGEAYFEVASDPKRPFVVEACGTITQALGTSFNIKAYDEDSLVKVSLLEGSVSVQGEGNQSILLSPGEELLASKVHMSFIRQQFAYDATFGWKEGFLVFDGADFYSFRNMIEKWYGVKVEVKGTPPDDWSIRARYQRESLYHVLQDISFNKKLEYDLQDKIVHITF